MNKGQGSTIFRGLKKISADYYYGFFLFFSLIVLLPFFPVKDPNTWKHLVDGKYLDLFRAIPHYSTFTITPAKNYVPGDAYNWLSHFILYRVYTAGGYGGLHILKFFIPLTVLWSLTSVFNYKFDVNWLSISVLVLIILSTKFYTRGASFGPIFLGFQLYFSWKYIESCSTKFLFYITPILVLWGNIHGSFLLGTYLFLSFITGIVLDNIFMHSRAWNDNKNIKMFFLMVLTVVAVIFVKPFPNYEPIVRVSGGFQEINQLFYENSKTSEYKVSSDASILSYVKNVTHEVLKKERPVKAEEFRFSLEKITDPIIFISLFIVPFLYLMILVFGYISFEFKIILPVLFIFWSGISIVRIVPYTGVTILFFCVVSLKNCNTQNLVSWVPISEDSWLMGRQKKIFLRIILLVVLGTLVFMTNLDGREYIFGKNDSPNSSIPDFVLRKYSDVPTFTSGEIGSYVLWRWWPRKKVFLQGKNRANTNKFLKKITKEHSSITRAWKTLMKYDLRLAILSKSTYNFGQNLFALHPEWRIMEISKSDYGMFLYCNCPLNNSSETNK